MNRVAAGCRFAVAWLVLAVPSAGEAADARGASPFYAAQVAGPSGGKAGQRQTREQAAPNAEPLDRIDSRIANRVQNRIRNRIDANYNPQANAASPFRNAEKRTGAVRNRRR